MIDEAVTGICFLVGSGRRWQGQPEAAFESDCHPSCHDAPGRLRLDLDPEVTGTVLWDRVWRGCACLNYTLAGAELRRDPLYGQLSAAQRRAYIQGALAIGYQQGERYRGRDVLALVGELGARLVVRDEEGVVAGIPTRAEYDAVTGRITVYRPSVEAFGRRLASLIMRPADVCSCALSESGARAAFGSLIGEGGPEWLALRVLVAHELFHHLEATRIRPVPEQLPSVRAFVAGGRWTVKRRVRSCGEIAAHAFAQALMALPFLPNLLDCLTPGFAPNPRLCT